MSSESSARLQVPYLFPAQAQKHVTVNEALLRLDALVQCVVESRTIAAQPSGPVDGALYVLPAGKTGAAWGAMAEGAIAYWRDGVWEALTPKPGWRLFVLDELAGVAWTGTAWAVETLALSAFGGFRNRLMNPSFTVNQRAFAGGALAAGQFGPDRWRAGPGGATLSIAGDVVTLTGVIEQPIEAAGLPAGSLAVSLLAPTASLTIDLLVGAAVVATGTIGPGAGRRSLRMTLPNAAPGAALLRLTAATSAQFGAVQLEPAGAAGPFEHRPPGVELALCQRYYWRLAGGAGLVTLAPCQVVSAVLAQRAGRPFPVPLRAVPAITASGLTVSDGATSSTATIAADRSSAQGLDLDFAVAGLASPQMGVVLLGPGAILEASAELA
jgi:hypothetical protein